MVAEEEGRAALRQKSAQVLFDKLERTRKRASWIALTPHGATPRRIVRERPAWHLRRGGSRCGGG